MTRLPASVRKAIVDEYRRGASNRLIARRVGVSHTTVNRLLRSGRVLPTPAEILDAAFSEITRRRRSSGVCPFCRRRVDLPCLACALRRIGLVAPVGDGDATDVGSAPFFPLGVELYGEERKRYLEIKKRKDKERALNNGEYNS